MSIVKRVGQRVIPRRFHSFAAAVYWLGNKHWCPICRWHQRSFRPMVAIAPSFNDWCSRCHSLGRHRLLWLYLQRRTNLFCAPVSVLHMAPEQCISSRLRRCPNIRYTSGDVEGGYTPGDEIIDLVDIHKPDESFDVVLCIHVLEHIENDRKAINEIYRVLKPGGWAILNSHYDHRLENTYEDPSITSPVDRRKHFNQADHYRVYGRDFAKRIALSGFQVRVDEFGDELGPAMIEKCFLYTPGQVYLCRKPYR